MIRTALLCKAYGDVRALDGLSLTVGEGSVYGYLGPNGAGKTTTLRILAGLARPTSGQAWVGGVEVRQGHDDLAERIGYLPEDPAFYPWFTPREFLDYVARIFRLPASERSARADEVLAQVGLSEVAGRRIGGFSRGMRQRLGLAQALLNRPPVLLLDEPASALDPAGRREVLELIGGLRGSATVLMSTHILADVERICDTVGIIARGRLVAEAGREELLGHYATPGLLVESEPGQEAALLAFAERARRAPWASGARLDGHVARIEVSDLAAARRELLPMIVAAGIPLVRYETVRPSLEDVFLRLVGEEEVP